VDPKNQGGALFFSPPSRPNAWCGFVRGIRRGMVMPSEDLKRKNRTTLTLETRSSGFDPPLASESVSRVALRVADLARRRVSSGHGSPLSA